MTGREDGPVEPRPVGVDAPEADAARQPRPWIERIGLAGIAVVMAGLFGTVAVASWYGGEWFLAAMGAIGCLMTVWVGALTVIRG